MKPSLFRLLPRLGPCLIFLLIGCANPESGDGVNNPSLPPGEWVPKTPNSQPPARILHAMAYDTLHHRVILFGGRGASGPLADTWAYDPVMDTWTDLSPASPPPARVGHAMVYDEFNSRVILFGGKAASVHLDDTWAFDVFDDTWTELSPVISPPARALTAMVYDSVTQQAILFGGETAAGLDNETWAYDVFSDNTWTNLAPSPSLPNPRSKHAMVYDTLNQQVILFGGETASSQKNSETWAYDVANNNWGHLLPPDPPSARLGHAMVYDSANGRTTMFGGFADGSSIPSAELWIYDSPTNQWSPLFPLPPIPQGRFLHAMVYDSFNKQAILFGGAIQGCGVGCTDIDSDFFKNDTWIYIPATD